MPARLKLDRVHGLEGQPAVCEDGSLIYSSVNGIFKSHPTQDTHHCLVQCRGSAPIASFCYNGAEKLLAWCEDVPQASITVASIKNNDELEVMGVIARDEKAFVGYSCMAFSPDGSQLVTVDSAPTHHLTLWDWRMEDALTRTQAPALHNARLSVSPLDWRHMLLWGEEGAVHLELDVCRDVFVWLTDELDLALGMRVRKGTSFARRNSIEETLDLDSELLDVTPLQVASVTWCDDSIVYAGCWTGELLEIDIMSLSVRVAIKSSAHGAGSFDAIHLLRDRMILLAAGNGHPLRWFKLDDRTGDLTFFRDIALQGLSPHVLMPDPTSSSGMFLAGINSGAHLDTETSALTQFVAGHASDYLCTCRISVPNGEDVIVSIGSQGRLIAYDAATGRHKSTLDVPVDRLTCASSCHALPAIVLGDRDGTIQMVSLLDPGSPFVAARVRACRNPVEGLVVDARGSRVCVAGDAQLLFLNIKLEVQAYLPVPNEAACTGLAAVDDPSTTTLCASFREPGHDDFHHLIALELPAHVSLVDLLSPDDPYRLLPPLVHLRSQRLPGNYEVTAASTQTCSLFNTTSGMMATMNHAALTKLPASFTSWPAQDAAELGSEHVAASLRPAIDQTGHTVSGDDDMWTLAAIDPSQQQVRLQGTTVLSERTMDGQSVQASVLANSKVIVAHGQGDLSFYQGNATSQMMASVATSNLSFNAQDYEALQAAKSIENDKRPLRGNTMATALDELLDEALRPSTVGSKEATAAHQTKLERQLAQLRDRLLQLIEDNEGKPDDERLDRSDFVLDVKESLRLQQDEEAAIQDLRDSVELEILREQFLRNNIKRQCWDSMLVKGRVLYAFDTKTEVSNYPLPARTTKELNLLKRVQTIRGIERAESFARQLQHEKDATRLNTAQADAGLDGEEGHSERPLAAPMPADLEQEADSSLLYTPLELTSTMRRQHQVVLLQDAIYQLKEDFNQLFMETVEAKQHEKAKIASLNEKIAKVCDELKVQHKPYVPLEHDLEQPERLLEVRDEEVKVERVLTAEQQAAKEEEERLEAERRANAEQDNAHERGIEDMMYSRLEGRDEDSMWEDLPVPAFIAEIPESQYNDEQKKAVQTYKKQLADLNELREKRKQALQAELRTLNTSVQATREKFDERLYELFQHKISVEQQISREELAIYQLEQCTQREQLLLNDIANMGDDLESAKQHQGHVARTVVQASNMVNSIQEEYNQLVQADKQLEKTFKTRKDLSQADAFVDVLFRLYRRRPKRYAHGMDVPELTKERDCPEGLDDHLWKVFLKIRKQKIASEQIMMAKGVELAGAKSFLQRRQAEEKEAALHIEGLIEEKSALQQEVQLINLDTSLLVNVKQGQVEVRHESDFDPNFEDAVLLHRDEVERLNNEVKQLATARIDHTRKKIEMGKGLRALEWESDALDLELEQLQDSIRETQLFKVKKDMGKKVEHSREVDLLEKTIKASSSAHERRIAEKKKRLKKMQRELAKRVRVNQTLDEELDGLASEVGERARVREVQIQAVGDGGQKERLRRVQHRRKLIELVKNQNEEMDVLRSEVERLRMKTFPTFGKAAHI
eukprot:TRINITY_DN10061_c0_g1_i4.p1 TRINITY_DN10061_c0_g1~~TRINITY_DN10061_c0_g1_i4.p1  ORF type:complete len:1577 (+),score=430.93 TRINITY_DN10061_c0_g1_i4:116-4846(+)